MAPPYLVSWSTFTWNATTSPNTALSVRLYYYDGASYVLIPDNVLAGNSAGYSGGVIDISTLPAAAYGSLQAEAALSTTDTAETPTLLEWKFAYTAGPTPLPNVAFDIHGAKTIGTASNGTPLYKYMGRYTTSASGEKLFDPVEWDIYTLSLPSGSPYTTVERCPFVVSVIPNEQKSVSVTLDDDTAGSLLMYVSGGGAPVLNADVTIVTYGAMTEIVEEAMRRSFDTDEILVEYVVPSQLAPLRIEPILESVLRTGRLLVAEEGTGPWGFGSEVIARVAEELGSRTFRGKRVAAYHLPIPNARPAEERVLPDVDRVVDALRNLVV